MRPVTCDLWPVTCDLWPVTFELCRQWVMTMALSYVNTFKVLPMNGEDTQDRWYLNLPPFVSNFNEYNTEYTSHKLQVTSYKSQVASHKLQVTSHKSQVASHKLQVTSPTLQVTSHKLQVTSCKL